MARRSFVPFRAAYAHVHPSVLTSLIPEHQTYYNVCGLHAGFVYMDEGGARRRHFHQPCTVLVESCAAYVFFRAAPRTPRFRLPSADVTQIRRAIEAAGVVGQSPSV